MAYFIRILAISTLFFLLPSAKVKAQINTDRMMTIGKNAMYFDDYVLAIQYFNLIINSKPYLYEPYFYRGLAKFYLEDYIGTEADCTQSIDKGPFFPSSYQVRGLARLNMGKYELAAEDYTKTASFEPNNRSVLHNLAVCHIKMQNWHTADSIADGMIRKWPKNAENYCLKANIKLENKDTISAEELIDQALQFASHNLQAISIKSALRMAKEDYITAEQYLSKAIDIRPRYSGYYINRGLCRYQQNNYRGAMSDYDTAIQLDSTNFIARYNRGLLRANVGENNLAINDFNYIISIDPDDIMAIFNRATLLDETGDYRGAIRDYTTVISEYPKFLLGYQKRAAARRKIGDMKGALSDEEHVLKEQIAHQYGYATTTSQQKNKVRKKSKVNLDEYRNPIIEDEESTLPAYKNEYRGKVQNVKVSLHPQTVYTLTYYENPNKIQVNNTYNNEIESVNSSKILPHKLLMNNHAINLNDQKFSEHINHIAYLQSKTTITSAEAFAIAIEYMLVNEFERAIEMFDTSITEGTHTSLSHFGKGTAHYKHAEAYAYIAAPDNKKGATSNNSIKAYHYREAVKHFDKAISHNPDFAEAHYNKGVAEMALSDFDTAIKDFDTAITLNPDLAEAHYNKGIILIQQGKTDEAITALSRAGELGLYTAYSIIKKHQKQNQ